MKLDRNNGIAILLIIVGAYFLLKFIGWGIGGLFSLLLPLLLIGLGIIGLKNGRNFIGFMLLLIGGISLIVKLASWLAPVLAVVLIIYGCSIVFKKRVHE